MAFGDFNKDHILLKFSVHKASDGKGKMAGCDTEPRRAVGATKPVEGSYGARRRW